jgi:hypothetical protein
LVDAYTQHILLFHLGYLDSVSLGIQPIQCQQVVSQPPDLLPDIPRPPMSDFLDIRATVPGFVSYRDEDTGKQ